MDTRTGTEQGVWSQSSSRSCAGVVEWDEKPKLAFLHTDVYKVGLII